MYKGRFLLTRTSVKYVKVANGTEISRNSALLNLRNANHSPEILEIPKGKLNGKKTSGKTTTYAQTFGNLTFPKIWAHVVVNFLSPVIFVFGYGKCMLMKLKKEKQQLPKITN